MYKQYRSSNANMLHQTELEREAAQEEERMRQVLKNKVEVVLHYDHRRRPWYCDEFTPKDALWEAFTFFLKEKNCELKPAKISCLQMTNCPAWT